MKTLSKLLITCMITTIGYSSQTTMCFTKDVKDITALEDIKLNGGECKSAYSLNDMKKDGWEVSDIKINNNDYIYILKKGSDISWNGTLSDTEALEERLLKKMEEKRKFEIEKSKIIQNQILIERGKSFYERKCKNCHGLYGELKPGYSRIIRDLSFEEFDFTMSGYRSGLYDKGSGTQMKAYASSTSDDDIKNIFNYLESINKK